MATVDKAAPITESEIAAAITQAKRAPAPPRPQPSAVLRAQLARGEEQGRSKNVGRV